MPVSRAESVWPALLPPALRKLGWVEGQNLTLEWRSAERHPERLPNLAAELVNLPVHLIVAITNAEAEAALHATRSTPIVMLLATDPVNAGFAASLAHPGGNVTGMMYADPNITGKYVQILKETLPAMRRIGLLYPRGAESPSGLESANAACRQLGIQLLSFPVTSTADLRDALALAKTERVDALSVYTGGAVSGELVREFTVPNRIPTSWTVQADVERGGLMSYTPKFAASAARAAAMIDKILKGAKPGDLPFEYPTQYELVINLSAAKKLGIAIPHAILARADRLIE